MQSPAPGTGALCSAEKAAKYMEKLVDECTSCAYALCKVPKIGCKKSFHMKYYEKFRYE